MNQPQPVLNQLDLVVRDVDAAVAFYRRLGLDIPESAVWRTASGAHHVDLTGYAGRQPPYDTFWGARYAVIEDPDGNHVGLMSPIDPARRRAPPAI